MSELLGGAVQKVIHDNEYYGTLVHYNTFTLSNMYWCCMRPHTCPRILYLPQIPGSSRAHQYSRDQRIAVLQHLPGEQLGYSWCGLPRILMFHATGPATPLVSDKFRCSTTKHAVASLKHCITLDWWLHAYWSRLFEETLNNLASCRDGVLHWPVGVFRCTNACAEVHWMTSLRYYTR